MNSTTRSGGISSFALHVLAMALMLCDHLWATIFPYLDWLTCLGRIAFPIFAFMAVEGYFHTRSFRRYMLRLLGFAFVSEIPFNLMYASSVSYIFHQNVLWTFLLGLGLIRLMEAARERFRTPGYLAACAGCCLLGFLLGTVTFVDYYGAGVLTVLMFYLLRKPTVLNRLLQALFLYFVFVKLIGGYYYSVMLFGREYEVFREAFCLLALIPIWLYKGRQGYHAKWFQWFCYAFYPAHMLVVYLVWQLVM